MAHPAMLALSLAALWASAGTDIRRVEGSVSVFLPSLNDWRPVAKVPFGLVPGDRVRMKPLSKAELGFDDGTWIQASQDAAFQVRQDNEHGTAITLEAGKIEVSVKRLRTYVFEVYAPGAKITLRADRATILVTPKKVVVVEVTKGLAEVTPAVGPSIQVPDEHRLEITPGKAPGLPMPLRELKQFINKMPAAKPGVTRKYQRRAERAEPAIGVAEPTGGKPAPQPELGAEGLGLPKLPAEKAAPALGVESLGLEPELGNTALGIKEPKGLPPDPPLGGKSLGLKEPTPDPKPQGKRPLAAQAGKAAPEPQVYRPKPVDTDISPLVGFLEYGVPQPKPKPKPKPKAKEPKPKAVPKAKAPAAEKPAEVYKAKPVSTDISPLIKSP